MARTVTTRIALVFGLDDAGWARHANPWSGWSRIATGLPLLVLAAWSRVWIGPWALAAGAVVALWLWLNPRLFPPARDDAAWVSKAVLGERFWGLRHEVPVPVKHHLPVRLLQSVAAIGTLVLVWGMIALDPWPTALGAVLGWGGKMWFVDRMAWVYEDVVAARPDLAYRPQS